MESYKMNKLNLNDFNEIEISDNNRHDFNVNLWDFEGSNFFVDKNFNENESKRGLVNITINSKNKSTSLKNINKGIKSMKAKNRSINSSYFPKRDSRIRPAVPLILFNEIQQQIITGSYLISTSFPVLKDSVAAKAMRVEAVPSWTSTSGLRPVRTQSTNSATSAR